MNDRLNRSGLTGGRGGAVLKMLCLPCLKKQEWFRCLGKTEQ